MAINRTDIIVVGGAILVGIIGVNWGERGASRDAPKSAGMGPAMREFEVHALTDCKRQIAAHVGAAVADIPEPLDWDKDDNGFLYVWEQGEIIAPPALDRRVGRAVSASCKGTLIPLEVSRVTVDNGDLF